MGGIKKNTLLLSGETTSGIFHQLRESEVRDWDDLTLADLELMEDYYLNIPFKEPNRDDIYEVVIAEKNRVMERSDWESAGVDRYGNRLSNKKRRAVTNYTKPKKRRKKK